MVSFIFSWHFKLKYNRHTPNFTIVHNLMLWSFLFTVTDFVHVCMLYVFVFVCLLAQICHIWYMEVREKIRASSLFHTWWVCDDQSQVIRPGSKHLYLLRCATLHSVAVCHVCVCVFIELFATVMIVDILITPKIFLCTFPWPLLVSTTDLSFTVVH